MIGWVALSLLSVDATLVGWVGADDECPAEVPAFAVPGTALRLPDIITPRTSFRGG